MYLRQVGTVFSPFFYLIVRSHRTVCILSDSILIYDLAFPSIYYIHYHHRYYVLRVQQISQFSYRKCKKKKTKIMKKKKKRVTCRIRGKHCDLYRRRQCEYAHRHTCDGKANTKNYYDLFLSFFYCIASMELVRIDLGFSTFKFFIVRCVYRVVMFSRFVGRLLHFYVPICEGFFYCFL